jgi:hypothetical protein
VSIALCSATTFAVEGSARGPAPAERRSQLSRAGFPAALAARAASARLDLHAAIELVERGCPPPLALRILAPE